MFWKWVVDGRDHNNKVAMLGCLSLCGCLALGFPVTRGMQMRVIGNQGLAEVATYLVDEKQLFVGLFAL